MADLAWFSALLILFCSSPGILRQPQHLTKERETFGYLFCPHTPYSSRVSLTGEEEERRRRKKMTIFGFFKIRFLGFYKAERKSEDIIGASRSEPHTTEFYAFLGILYIIIIYYLSVRPLTKCACVKCFT